jgi:hypothetical protein
MTPHALAHETVFDVRWRAWQAHGVAGDRQRTALMRRVITIVVIGFVAWLSILIV